MENMNNPDSIELRQRRENNQQQFRRQKRQEVFKKKRNFNHQDQNIDNIDININQDQSSNTDQHIAYNPQQHLDNNPLKSKILELLANKYNPKDLLCLLHGLQKYHQSCQQNPDDQQQSILEQHRCIIGIRKIVSDDEDNAPIQELIDSNGVPLLLQMMENDEQPHLQLEAAWVLTNVVCGTTQQTLRVIQYNGIKYFVKLLHHRYLKVAEQAIWALGNIAGDNYQFRDQILQQDAIVPIRNLIYHPQANTNTVNQGIWTLSNLCRGQPLPQYEHTKEAMEVFCFAIKKLKNLQTLSDAAWALSYLSDGDSKRIDKIIQTGVVPFVIQYLTSPMISLQIPCLRILGNLTTGADQQTDYCLDCGLLPQLFNFLQTDNPAIQREILWTISNICCGSLGQIKKVIQTTQYVKYIVQLMETTKNAEISEEILYIWLNVLIKGGQDEVQQLYDICIIKHIIAILDDHNQFHKVLIIALNILNKMFAYGQNILFVNGQNLFLQQFNHNCGIGVLEKLQQHPSDEIYEQVSNLIQQFFDVEEEEY